MAKSRIPPEDEEEEDVYESVGDAPLDEPPPDEGDAGAEGIDEDDGA